MITIPIPNIPTGKYFISHSYKDAAVRDEFLKFLPPSIQPFIFPPINASPLEFVSSTLIGAILACDGLIYLNEGASQTSFWVAFERDYALRSKKPVLGYTPSTQTLYEHTDPPLDLAVYPSFSHPQRKEVMPIIEFMRKQRHFDPWMEDLTMKLGASWSEELQKGLAGVFQRGGYVVAFLGSFNSQYMVSEMLAGIEQKRLIVASLGVAPPDFIQPSKDLFIQLIENDTVNNNRIDDLIVRLYWLMFRIQFPQYIYE